VSQQVSQRKDDINEVERNRLKKKIVLQDKTSDREETLIKFSISENQKKKKR
jgi:hypothetical protein